MGMETRVPVTLYLEVVIVHASWVPGEFHCKHLHYTCSDCRHRAVREIL